MQIQRSILTSILLISGLFLAIQVNAQKDRNEKYSIGLEFGGRNINRDSLTNTRNLDFMNYLYEAKNQADYGYLGINFSFMPDQSWGFRITTVVQSNLLPNQFNFDVQYSVDTLKSHLKWGLLGSIFAYPQYLEEYNQYHILQDTGFTADLNTNFRQISIFDLGVSAGTFFGYQYKRLHVQARIKAGVCGFASFDESISQKKTNANLRREIRYETEFSPAFFVNPEVELDFDLIKNRRSDIGIQLRAGSLFSKRSINYTRTTLTWTTENAIINKVQSPKQFYSMSEIECGIYVIF